MDATELDEMWHARDTHRHPQDTSRKVRSMAMTRWSTIALLLTSSQAARVNTTLYHINPLSYPFSPVNMDLGDLAGDLLFDVSQVANVFPCSTPGPKAPGVICNNAETSGDDIGVTKVHAASTSHAPTHSTAVRPTHHVHVCAHLSSLLRQTTTSVRTPRATYASMAARH